MSPVRPDDWRRATEIFHHAIARPPAERQAFLDEACGGDTALLDEVSSLVRSHERAGSFLETPITAAGSKGKRIGPYRILREIGAGGMGVVYLAEDTRLGRTVALKAVAPAFALDPERRERLRREARAAAALSHPGIATVYALDEIDGALYIAAEFVRGETLREELDHGAAPVSLAIDTAAAIAHALAAAHDRGIVHRDLKPENIVRSPHGRVAILDFGIARLPGVPGDALPGRDDETRPGSIALTAAGAVLGTPAYMSPEQLRGAEVDFRSDQFSFGVLVYELVAGAHPFAGVGQAETVAGILARDPEPLAARRRPAPPGLAGLDAILMRCLSKDPAGRFDSTAALAEALDALRTGTASSGVYAPAAGEAPRPTSPLWWWQFHQLVVSGIYGVLLIPMWLARGWIGGTVGLVLFLLAVIAATGADTLRLHLWFTSKVSPDEWSGQRGLARGWLRAADVTLSLSLAAAGILVAQAHAGPAILLLGGAVAITAAYLVIEPATTNAASRMAPPAEPT